MGMGRYRGTVTEQYERYARPQENGNKEDVRWAALTDHRGAGLLIVGAPTLMFGALRYTSEELDEAKHIHKVKPRGDVVVCLDHAQMGLGGASCGPRPMAQYQLHVRPWVFDYVLRPCTSDRGDPSMLARQILPGA